MNDSLGEFEVLILAGVVAARENAYGMMVQQEVETLVGPRRTVSIGAVYTTLARLEEKGFIEAWNGAGNMERGGRAKRFFRITAPGKRALNESLRPMAKALKLLGGLKA